MSRPTPPKLLKVKVKLASDFSYQNNLINNGVKVYKTLSKCRGVMKIININKIAKKQQREGSEIDVRNLQSLFEQIVLTVDVYQELDENKTKKNLLNCVRNFVKDERLKLADMAILFIMSHGDRKNNKDVFYTSDGDFIEYDTIKRYFSNNSCRNMQYKPKLIFFQTCRGIEADSGTEVVNVDLQHDGNTSPCAIIPSCTDLLVACATTPEHVAFRWRHVGSLFINRLCEEFMNNAYKHDVATMLDHVYKQMSEDILEKNGSTYLQTGEYTKTAFVQCFLNPGVYRVDSKVRNIFTDEFIETTTKPTGRWLLV